MSLQNLRADAYRQSGRGNWVSICKLVILNRNFRPIATLRLCQALVGGNIISRCSLPVAKAFHRIACHLACIDFSWKTEVGAGFAITHGWGLVISPGARVGRNVTIFHGATLGRGDKIARDGSRQSGYPVVEDEVWIGPGAIVVGNVVVGAGSRICGGAYVTEDVAPFSVVVGNPACVVKTDCMPDVMNKVCFS